jgi:hypothetical protein
MNRLPSFACRTGDSAFGLGYSVSKVLKFGKLRSECLKTLAQSELAIIQPRTITHCTPLHYCTAPVGRRWDHPKAKENSAIMSVRFWTPAVLFHRGNGVAAMKDMQAQLHRKTQAFEVKQKE